MKAVFARTIWLCAVTVLLSACRGRFEILDIGPVLNSPGEVAKARNTVPLSVGVRFLRDQAVLNSGESSMEVTLYFLRTLAESRLFESVSLPLQKGGEFDLILVVDFERRFDLHHVSNAAKNVALIGSAGLLYRWLEIQVDYEIAGEITAEIDGKAVKTYRQQQASRVRMGFLAPVNLAADQLSQRTMEKVSQALVAQMVKDEAWFLAQALGRARS
jgi:hypothetical protein